MSSKIKVMIVDDHALMREGLTKLLEMENKIEVLYGASDGLDAINYLENSNGIDVILLDINMPKLNGIETLKKIKQINPAIKVIMLTVYDDREYLIETLNLGSNGYVLKDSETDSLIKAIESVYDGGSYIHPSLAGELFTHTSHMNIIL